MRLSKTESSFFMNISSKKFLCVYLNTPVGAIQDFLNVLQGIKQNLADFRI